MSEMDSVRKAVNEGLTVTKNSVSTARLGAETVNDLAQQMVERIAFASGTDAEAAVADLAAENKTFEALVTDRGLTLADVDLGDDSQDMAVSKGKGDDDEAET